MKKLTRKQKAFADYLIKNPKKSATQAAKHTYGSQDKELTRRTASAIAVDNLAKPSIQAYLEIHADKASDTVLEVMNVSRERFKKDSAYGEKWGALALNSAKDVLDRVHGKATQKTEVTGQVVSLSVSLSDITKPAP